MLPFPCSLQLTTSKEYKSPLIPLQLGLLQWCICWCWSVPLSTSTTALAGADHHSVKANVGWRELVSFVVASCRLLRKTLKNGRIEDWETLMKTISECCWPWQRAAQVCFSIHLDLMVNLENMPTSKYHVKFLHLFDHFYDKASACLKMMFHLVRSSKLLNVLIWCKTTRRSRESLRFISCQDLNMIHCFTNPNST